MYFAVQANREAVLNRSPDLNEVRLHTFHNTTAVYDLLTIALVRRAQFNMLCEVRHQEDKLIKGHVRFYLAVVK